jgi:UDP-N-acetyl-D-galactosamine dehydrogenase
LLFNPRIAVVGLGYVGLPLAVALAARYAVTGYDVDPKRIQELKNGREHTGEVEPAALRASSLRLVADAAQIKGHDVYIVTVPTPVDADNKPDLAAIRNACETIGRAIGKNAIVVLESTVYPGVTEEVCGPLIARISGLACGVDFFLGYSPERINPGDKVHTVERITKVVAGQTPAVTETLKAIYGAITSGGVFVARDIKTAEAAKVIENAQRDINIAFINEIAMIVDRLGLSIHDVLDASATKWNFLKFQPGLVGGHCIGVDPFYLAALAERLGHDPAVILAGRRINDAMGAFVARRVHDQLGTTGVARILVLGLTFKENVRDLRNSKAIDVIEGLARHGHRVSTHDPLADPTDARAFYGIDLLPSLDGLKGFDAVVGLVPHEAYTVMTAEALSALTRPGGLIADIKGMWRRLAFANGIRRWQL